MSGIPGQAFNLKYMKRAGYFLVDVAGPPPTSTVSYSPETRLYRPDGRYTVVSPSISTANSAATDPFGSQQMSVVPSPSGKHFAVGGQPGGKVRSLTIQVYDACTFKQLLTTTVTNFKGDFQQYFRWKSETEIFFTESQIFAYVDQKPGEDGTLRYGTWTLDLVTLRPTIPVLSSGPINPIYGQPDYWCYGLSSPTTSSQFSHDGFALLAQQRPAPTCDMCNYMRDDMGSVPVATVWDFALDRDVSTYRLMTYNCDIKATHTEGSGPDPQTACNCGQTSKQVTSDCRFVWSAGCAASEKQVSKSSCKLGWWDFASTGSKYTCSSFNGIVAGTCSATTASSSGFVVDGSVKVLSEPKPGAKGRDGAGVAVVGAAALVIGGGVHAKKRMLARKGENANLIEKGSEMKQIGAV